MQDFTDVLDRLKTEPAKALPGIAVDSGVPYATLRKLREGSTKNPRIQTVQRVADYYRRESEAA